MRAAAVQWDLSSMGPEELLSEGTIFFLAKVLAAASVVAFGPALVLEYVPTSKVDVRDVSSAGSQAGRIQRLLLAFAGGGLMAEAALHLLPHLFLPKHDHDDHGHESLADACTLIAVGFLAAFAIDRFVGVRQQRQNGAAEAAAAAPAEGKEEAAAVTKEEAAAVTAAAHTAAARAGLSDSGEAVTAGETTDANSEGQQEDDEQQQRKQGGGGGGGGGEPEDPTRELLEYSSASVEDEGSAAGAMLASAHMSQTPEKRVSTASSESCRAGAPEVVELFPAVAPSSDSAVAAPSSPELTLYGNPKDAATTGQEGSPADAAVSKGHAVLVRGGGGDAACSKGDHHQDHHDHGPADAGAYVTLAVDFLHNLIDGIGIGAAYAVGGDAVGHATAALKLVHEVQHEIGDVATLVQCGMSKHHAIHIQHTTAAGVFLGVAISLGAGAFPEGLLAACLALSAGATFHLASGPVLGPVLAIPADVGGPVQGLLEVAALAAGAAGVVAIGLAEGWAGIGH